MESTHSQKTEVKAPWPSQRVGHAYNITRQTFLAQKLRTADTHWSRLKGLLGTSQSEFAPGCALWIIPCQGIHTMGMRYAIDVIFLDADWRVVHMEENLKPWHISSVRLDASSAIELPAHTAWETGTEMGDQIEIVTGDDMESV